MLRESLFFFLKSEQLLFITKEGKTGGAINSVFGCETAPVLYNT